MSGHPKIILVEDDAFQRQVIVECLAQHGLKSTAFGTATEMKRSVQNAMPDLALLDVRLNDPEDGFALARWLRGRSARVGIIMLTSGKRHNRPCRWIGIRGRRLCGQTVRDARIGGSGKGGAETRQPHF